jgi:hypothetical protein
MLKVQDIKMSILMSPYKQNAYAFIYLRIQPQATNEKAMDSPIIAYGVNATRVTG